MLFDLIGVFRATLTLHPREKMLGFEPSLAFAKKDNQSQCGSDFEAGRENRTLGFRLEI